MDSATTKGRGDAALLMNVGIEGGTWTVSATTASTFIRYFITSAIVVVDSALLQSDSRLLLARHLHSFAPLSGCGCAVRRRVASEERPNRQARRIHFLHNSDVAHDSDMNISA
jgi:hypothetical protein